MNPARNVDPIIKRFRQTVAQVFGDKVERVILFGSRARSDARSDSDYDLAVFLHDVGDRIDALNQLADIGTDILYESGCLIHALPYGAGAYAERSPLMHEIRRDGVEV